MTEHTPGTWTAVKCEHSPSWYVCNDTEVLAHVGTGLGMTRAMIAANAHLIAAAPELLEACEAAMRYDASICGCAARGEYSLIEGGGGVAEGEDLDELYADWIDKAREAIAKARPQPSGA